MNQPEQSLYLKELDGTTPSPSEGNQPTQLCRDCSQTGQVVQLYEIIRLLQIENEQLRQTYVPDFEPPPPPRAQFFQRVRCECDRTVWANLNKPLTQILCIVRQVIEGEIYKAT